MKLVDTETLLEYTLPSLHWEDEFSWTNAVGTNEYSLTGALIQQSGKRLKGRPITLVGPDEEMGWAKRSLVSSLQDLANLTDRKFTLVLLSGATERQFSVRFRHDDKALEAEPVYTWQPTDEDSWYKLTLRLLEV